MSYKLTDVCFSKLRREVIGENTSTDEFVNNSQSKKKLEESYALATRLFWISIKVGSNTSQRKHGMMNI